ncbi:MAG TPA: helix-turn-helix transcriptional regulator [Pseudobdellovibrionaceae bacterium]|jgi:transcriptional regulator with XRE-family HTH domain
MDITTLQKAAREFGLLSLSKKTGLARSYLYKVVEGTSSPTIEALDKIADVLGFAIELHRMPLEDSVKDVSSKVAQGGSWKIHFFNFVDAFRRTKNPELVISPPIESLDEKERVLLASMTVELCLKLGVEIPEWAKAQRPLKYPWFVAGVESLKPMAIVESPISFKRNNIFVLENFLARA